VVYKHNPLPMHQRALPAAIAAAPEDRSPRSARWIWSRRHTTGARPEFGRGCTERLRCRTRPFATSKRCSLCIESATSNVRRRSSGSATASASSPATKGEAAKVVAQGHATAKVLEDIAATYTAATASRGAMSCSCKAHSAARAALEHHGRSTGRSAHRARAERPKRSQQRRVACRFVGERHRADQGRDRRRRVAFLARQGGPRIRAEEQVRPELRGSTTHVLTQRSPPQRHPHSGGSNSPSPRSVQGSPPNGPEPPHIV
jgi:hypothetical protein